MYTDDQAHRVLLLYYRCHRLPGRRHSTSHSTRRHERPGDNPQGGIGFRVEGLGWVGGWVGWLNCIGK